MKHLGGVEEPPCVVATTEEMGVVGAGGHSRKDYSTYSAGGIRASQFAERAASGKISNGAMVISCFSRSLIVWKNI